MDPYELLLDCARSPHPLRWTPLIKACGRKLLGLLARALARPTCAAAAAEAVVALAPPPFAEIVAAGFSEDEAPDCVRARLRAVLSLRPESRPLERESQVRALLTGLPEAERAWLPAMFECLDSTQRDVFLDQLPSVLAGATLAWTLAALFELSAEPRHRQICSVLLGSAALRSVPGPRHWLASQSLDTPAGLAHAERLALGEHAPPGAYRGSEPRVYICSPEGWSYDSLLAAPVAPGLYATRDLRMKVGGGLVSSGPVALLSLRGLWAWRRALEADACVVAELPAGNGLARLRRDLDAEADALLPDGDFAVATDFGTFFQAAERESAAADRSDRLYARPEFDFFMFLPHEFELGDLVHALQLFYEREQADRDAPGYQAARANLVERASRKVEESDGAREQLKAALRLFAELYFYNGQRLPATTVAAVHRALFSKALHEVPFCRAMLEHSIELELDGRIAVEVIEDGEDFA